MEFVHKTHTLVGIVRGCNVHATRSVPDSYIGPILEFANKGKVLCNTHHANVFNEMKKVPFFILYSFSQVSSKSHGN